MSEYEGWPTTRCYPRTMREAFKDDVENAQWWYPPEKTPTWQTALLMWVAVALWIGLAYFFAKD